MKAEANKASGLRVTAVIDEDLHEGIEQHRRHLIERTGLQVSTSAAAAQLMRAGLAAASKQQAVTKS